jgi:hypothetical protein
LINLQQLGIGSEANSYVPTVLEAVRGLSIRQVTCGASSTAIVTGVCSHPIIFFDSSLTAAGIITAKGEVYTFGMGRDFVLGHGAEANEACVFLHVFEE